MIRTVSGGLRNSSVLIHRKPDKYIPSTCHRTVELVDADHKVRMCIVKEQCCDLLVTREMTQMELHADAAAVVYCAPCYFLFYVGLSRLIDE